MMNPTYKTPLIWAAVLLAIFACYGLLVMRDHRSVTEKVGDAIHDLPQGPVMAERQLEDRTAGQKLGDAVKDAGDSIKKNSNP